MRTTNWQLFRFTIIYLSSQTIIFLIPILISSSSYQGWIALLGGFLLSLIFMCFTVYVGKLRPNQAWINFGEDIVGKWPHKLVLLVILCWSVYYVSNDIENFVLFFGSNYFRGTPPLFIQCVLAVVIMYTAMLGFPTIVYMADGIFLGFLLTIIILFILFVPLADFNMMPAFIHYHNPGIALKDSTVVWSWFGEWFIFLFIAPDIKFDAKVLKKFIFASAFVLVAVLIGWTLIMMSFGPHLGQELQYPFLEMVRSSRQDSLLGNTDPLLIGLWSSTMFIHSSFLIYIASKCISKLTNRRMKLQIPILTLISLIIAYLYSRNIGVYYRHYNSFATNIVWIIVETIPIYYAIIGFFRYRKKTAKRQSAGD